MAAAITRMLVLAAGYPASFAGDHASASHSSDRLTLTRRGPDWLPAW